MDAGTKDVRQPAVAGRFYPGDAREIARQVAGFIGSAEGARARRAIVAPHAGYVYSGPVAGKVYAATVVPDRVVVLAPNHTGQGSRRSLWARGALAYPGARIPVDEELAAALIAAGVAVDDRLAHEFEHSLEVHLPFLHARNPALRVTPIVLGHLDLDECRELGQALGRLAPPDALVVASSDMNHYLDEETTRRRDHRALEPLLALDAAGLYQRVLAEDHSMCGFLPATVAIEFARHRGATTAELIAYGTSGDAFGDYGRVVGYAGVAIS